MMHESSPKERAARAQTAPQLSINDQEFSTFRRLIHRVAGIHLSESKRQLLCSRLAKRLRHHRLRSFTEYYAYLKKHDADGSELRQMVNCITTNETHFFREPHHFEFLTGRVLPEIARGAAGHERRRLRIWSAGCSTGEEPYSIAMAVSEQLKPRALWDVKILASDIDTEVLCRAEEGTYAREKLEDVDERQRRRWFDALTPDGHELRVREELRELVIFRCINLVEERWPINTQFDVIFCRNVTIYFDRATQQRLYERFARLLRPGGYMIAGHSENLIWLNRLFTPIGKTVYQLSSRRSPESRELVVPTTRAPATAPATGAAPRRHAAASLREVTLVSGGIHASREPSSVRTLLGSCVAVCLHDPVSRIGGMNHFMLPDVAPASLAIAACGIHAMELLINELMKLGAQRQRLVARVFGAANVLRNGRLGVPEANARFALEFLVREGIQVVEKRVGGQQPMRVTFLTHTGEARVRAVGEERERAAQSDERHLLELRRDLAKPASSRVELF